MNQGVFKLAVNGQLDLERIARDLLETDPCLFISLAENQVRTECSTGDEIQVHLEFPVLNGAKVIASHIRADHLADAIKTLRMETNLSLKDAKAVVYSVARRYPQIKDLAHKYQGYAIQIREEL
ncbi:MAG TPA: hypothetical protein PK317_00280 [Coprothermobacter proteolyticus]|nr:hypothetical protein [Coprothermobacter proteolyticus]